MQDPTGLNNDWIQIERNTYLGNGWELPRELSGPSLDKRRAGLVLQLATETATSVLILNGTSKRN